ncbi:MAG: putative metal-binding motif-containing protein [Myxococcales bacterium]|nr:putative metal-binding motif-containing protein [Myxococcales bacterium]
MSSHAGIFGGSHGRTFEGNTATPETEATRGTANLVFGQGSFNRTAGVSFSALSVSPSFVPAAAVILAGLPENQPLVWTDRARMSVDVEDAADFRITTDPDDFPSILFWWSAGSYALPEVVDGTFNVASAYQLFDAGDFFPLVKSFVPLWELGIIDDVIAGGVGLHAFVQGIALNETNTIAHHKPDVMLASAQDKLAGRPSFQNHSWSAALDGDIAVFTTHPLLDAGNDSDYFSYFTGGASHPRIAQHEDVALILYNPVLNWPIDLFPENANTHAVFPFDRFDETETVGNWTFGRKGTGYIGLYSHGPNFVPTTGRYANREIVAPGKRQLWICEIGDALEDGSFGDFIDRVSAQAVTFGGPPDYATTYASDMGVLAFDWTGPFTVDGAPEPITGYPRYDNPFTHVDWMDRRFEITAGGETSILDFDLGDCVDADNDGWGSPANAECPELDADCDDANAAVNPGAAEVAGNGIDDDCDGEVDEAPPPLCGTLGDAGDGGGFVLAVLSLGYMLTLRRVRRGS